MMDTQKRIGVIGGYGRLGLATVRMLLSTTACDVVVGGRDRIKTNAVSEKMGGRVSGRMVDVMDAHSLDHFCRGCNVIINCAGPSHLIGDKAAAAAMRCRAHYVDPADTYLYHMLAEKKEEIKQKGLTFLVCAGMNPGLLEILPIHVANRFEDAGSMDYYFVSQDRVSFSGAYDIISGLHTINDAGMMFYEKGEIKKSKSSPMTEIRLPQPMGKVTAFLTFKPEMKDVAGRCKLDKARFYTVLGGATTRKVLFEARLSRQMETHAQREFWATRLMKALNDDFKTLRPGNMFHLVMEGRMDGESIRCHTTLFYNDAAKLSGIVAANAARLICEGEILGPGCFLMWEGIRISKLMALLEEQNIHANHEIEKRDVHIKYPSESRRRLR
jgi:saccharopine dehydrogenase (NAD+, L-lysine forming)